MALVPVRVLRKVLRPVVWPRPDVPAESTAVPLCQRAARIIAHRGRPQRCIRAYSLAGRHARYSPSRSKGRAGGAGARDPRWKAIAQGRGLSARRVRRDGLGGALLRCLRVALCARGPHRPTARARTRAKAPKRPARAGRGALPRRRFSTDLAALRSTSSRLARAKTTSSSRFARPSTAVFPTRRRT